MHLTKVTLHPEKYPAADQYPFNLKLIQETDSLRFTSAVTFFVGENGSGKSTLLEAITRKCGIIIWQGITRPPRSWKRLPANAVSSYGRELPDPDIKPVPMKTRCTKPSM
jgi:hypothetical protein